MDDPLLFRIILSTTKGERKNFSKTMFWGDLSYRTDKEKNKLRIALNLTFIFSSMYFLSFFYFVIIRQLQLWLILGFIFALYCLFLALIIPYGDYYVNEYKSIFSHKIRLIKESSNFIDFYEDYIRYNGLNETNFDEFNFTEVNNSFHLKFLLNENSKAKLEGFFLLKYQDVENSGVDIEAFRTFLCEKANASDE